MAPHLKVWKTFKNKFFLKKFIDPFIISTTNSELDVVVIDLAQVETDLVNTHKGKKKCMNWIVVSKIHGL